MSTKPQFSFENIKEHYFFEDNYKRFKIANTITQWTTTQGVSLKPNISLYREYRDSKSGEWKTAARLLFPINVWKLLVENIHELTNKILIGKQMNSYLILFFFFFLFLKIFLGQYELICLQPMSNVYQPSVLDDDLVRMLMGDQTAIADPFVYPAATPQPTTSLQTTNSISAPSSSSSARSRLKSKKRKPSRAVVSARSSKCRKLPSRAMEEISAPTSTPPAPTSIPTTCLLPAPIPTTTPIALSDGTNHALPNSELKTPEEALRILLQYFDNEHAHSIIAQDETLTKLKKCLFRSRIRSMFLTFFTKYDVNGFISFDRLGDLCVEIFYQLGLFPYMLEPCFILP